MSDLVSDQPRREKLTLGCARSSATDFMPHLLPDRAGSVPGQRRQSNYILSRLPRLLFENPLHHAGADAESSADLENAVSVGSQLQYARLDRGLNPTPAQLRTFRPSRSLQLI